MNDERRTDHPCPACGGRSYSWGQIQAHQFRFVPDGASMLYRFFGGNWWLRARRCDHCGSLQVFTEPDPSQAGKPARKPEADDLS